MKYFYFFFDNLILETHIRGVDFLNHIGSQTRRKLNKKLCCQVMKLLIRDIHLGANDV
jgi:hypothetical protein